MQDENFKTIGERIRLARKAMGITLETLASLTSYSAPLLSKVERGQVRARPRLIRAISKALEAPEEWLQSGTGERFNPSSVSAFPGGLEQKELISRAHAVCELSRALFGTASELENQVTALEWPKTVRYSLTMIPAPGLDGDVTIPPAASLLEDLRSRLKACLEGHGSQSDLARVLGVSRQAVSEWVSGASAPEAGTILRLLWWVQAEEARKSMGSAGARTPAEPETRPGNQDEQETQSGPGKRYARKPRSAS